VRLEPGFALCVPRRVYRLRKEREEREGLHARFDAAYAAHQAKGDAKRRRT